MRGTARLLAAVAGLCIAYAAHADHPLITEDTGVLGKGAWQVQLHGERARERSGGATTRTSEASVQLGYGVAEKADLQLELPNLRQTVDDATGRTVASGRGDISAALKWRFLDEGNLSMVLKPDLLLPTGRDELGLGAGRVRWALNLIAGYEWGNFELIGHAGYTRNRNRIGERASLWHVSAALLWSATEKLRLLVDLGWDSNPDPAGRTPGREIVYGLTYAVSKDVDLGIGLKRGLNDPADDRAVRAGAKLRF